MDQKFELRLTSTETIPNPTPYFRAVFSDFKGCAVLDAVKEDEEYVVTMQVTDVIKAHTDEQLMSGCSMLASRKRGLRIHAARTLTLRNVLAHVNKILVSSPIGTTK